MDLPVRILLADDNDRVRPMISNVISAADPNWEVCSEVPNGQLAVQKAAELKPDLVVLDFSMPVLDGISAGREIRSILPDVPVLLYTFVSSARIEHAAKEAGITAVIEKADFRKLIQEMRSLVPDSQTASPSTPVMRKGHVYRCQNPDCGAEIRVKKESIAGLSNPICCCGAQMTRAYEPPALIKVKPEDH
jgi:CheY-like chemotaxis protein